MDLKNKLDEKIKKEGFESHVIIKSENEAQYLEFPHFQFNFLYTSEKGLFGIFLKNENLDLNKIPIGITDFNNDLFVIMKADELFRIVKDTDYCKTIFCPSCKTDKVSKNGLNIKGRRRYRCNNENCVRSSFDV